MGRGGEVCFGGRIAELICLSKVQMEARFLKSVGYRIVGSQWEDAQHGSDLDILD